MQVDQNTSNALLTVDEAAQFLNISSSYMNKLRCFGGGPVYVRLGRAVRYHLADLETWIAMNRQANTAANDNSALSVELRRSNEEVAQ